MFNKSKRFPFFLLLAVFLFIYSCGNTETKNNSTESHDHGKDHSGHHGHVNKHMHKTPVKELIKRFDEESRMEWQKPELVIEYFGDMSGKTFMDIGAGSGYFTFLMAKNAAKVIAADVNIEFLDHIASKANDLNIENIDTLLIPYSGPSSDEYTLDGIIIVNTYHHIENRIDYFRNLKGLINSTGSLMIVDFKKKQINDDVPGPPERMRMSNGFVKNELVQSGFTDFTIDSTSLPYQYILMAK